MNALQVVPVEGLPEVREGDDVAALIADAAKLEDGDVLVVAHKIVSKAEGRVVRIDDLEPSKRARELAGDDDPRHVEAILREAVRIVRVRGSLVIAVADELAGAAELVMGKVRGVPAAVIRGFEPNGDGTASELVLPAERDLFR